MLIQQIYLNKDINYFKRCVNLEVYLTRYFGQARKKTIKQILLKN